MHRFVTIVLVLLVLAAGGVVESFAPVGSKFRPAFTKVSQQRKPTEEDNHVPGKNSKAALTFVALTPLLLALPADAVEVANAVPAAFAAYGHYLGLILVSFCLAAERLLVKPNMSAEDELKLVFAGDYDSFRISIV